MSANGGRWKARLGGRGLGLVVRGLGASCRHRLLDQDRLEALVEAERPVILATWHQALFLAASSFFRHFVRRGVPLAVLISRSRDGDLGASMVRRLGARAVRGSTSRGGGPALRRLARDVADRGSWPVVIPDGPRGPARVAKPGALALSRLTGAPIVPVGFAVDRGWRLSSWDRTWIPKPGARLAVTLGEPWRMERDRGSLPSEELTGRLDEVFGRARSALESGE